MSNLLKTPCFIMYQERLDKNLNRLNYLEEQAGVKILHTLKSFSQESVLPQISSKISGVSVGSIRELSISFSANFKDVHFYAPAYKKEELLGLKDNIATLSFNSLGQWEHFSDMGLKSSLGLRINPRLHLPIPSYCNPNLSYSRLGIDYIEFLEAFDGMVHDFSKLEGLHFHALFQSPVEGILILLDHIEEHYQSILPQLKWINLGGGHNFTDDGYDVDKFIAFIQAFFLRYPEIELIFEPGESVVKGCGDFIATVLDKLSIGGQSILILDTSIETHLLDVAIVNQRLKVKGTQSSSTSYYYELTGNSCLQGDVIGEYFFEKPVSIGDKIVFEDMMGYTMVKMTEFNGMERAEFTLI